MPGVELRHLEYFVAVAPELNFSRAAQRIHVVQSALSASVSRLEKELGVELFDRSKRQIALTAPGEVFLEHAREVMHTAHRARTSVDAFRDQLAGTVTLMSWGTLNLPAALQEFRGCNPLVTVRLRQRLTGSAGHLTSIADGQMDLALVSITSSGSQLLTLRELMCEPMVFVCESSHPLADRRRVQLADLASTTSSTFRPDGEYGSASTRASPPPASSRSAPTKSPTMRSPLSSSGTDWRRQSCLPASPTVFPTCAQFRCVQP
jgi:DNA-binding transcriptional LysR family regulator